MTFKTLAAVLVGVAFAAPAYAQSGDAPPNAVEEQSFAAPRAVEPVVDAGISFAFEQSTMPPESQGVIPLAPRTGKGTETQPVDKATVK